MKVPMLFCIFVVILFEVHAKSLDSGTKANESTSASASASSTLNTPPVPSQKNKKRYATKEVILYLTPSQIRALEAGKGLISPQSLPESLDQEQLINQDVKLQEQTEFVKQEFENIKSASIQQVEQPDVENFELESQEPLLQKELLSTENQQEFFDQWRQEEANREEQLKFHNFYQEINKAEHLNLQEVKNNGEGNAWLTYRPNTQITEGYAVQEPQPDDHNVDRNKFKLKVSSSLPLYTQNSERFPSPTAKPLLQLQYSPKYNDQEKAIEIEKILRTRHRHELEKQSALSQAEQIANSPAVLVHEQVKITKQHSVPVVKQVKPSVPAPVLVPVPVKVSQHYPVLQDIIKHVAVPIIQRESAEMERPVPYVQRQVPGSVIKTIFFNVEGPYFDKKIVPVEIKAWN